MTMAKKAKKIDLHDMILNVKEGLSLLPGDEERQRMAQQISEITAELDVLRDNILKYPHESEIHQVSGAILTLVSFLNSVKDKPLLAESLFPKKTKARKAKGITVDTDAVLNLLEGLSAEKIPEELAKYKKDTLVDLAAKLNISVNTKLKKDALADKIFKLGFANKRGYDLLSGKESG